MVYRVMLSLVPLLLVGMVISGVIPVPGLGTRVHDARAEAIAAEMDEDDATTRAADGRRGASGKGGLDDKGVFQERAPRNPDGSRKRPIPRHKVDNGDWAPSGPGWGR
jgi:hypothetical protein